MLSHYHLLDGYHSGCRSSKPSALRALGARTVLFDLHAPPR